MLDILNLMFLGATVLSSIVLYSDADYPVYSTMAEINSVTEVSMHREWWREDGNGKCRYTGLVVPFVRDWDQVNKTRNTETVIPAEPNKVAGQAIILNKKVCNGKPDEAILRGVTAWRATKMLENWQFYAEDLTDSTEENRPKWFKQVMQRIQTVAAQDEKANAFVEATAPTLAAMEEKDNKRKADPAAASEPVHSTAAN
ncbi:hypothetical protein QU481_10980 [Crenobacter sp. SG2303]|uniref:DUF4124 domain-containing protein n=1 Tax=Crenobacter oryzisoli TaxID=3056844 RepID=A0ABT7XPB3_9NEIS|nr:hypothetical protein [Crenobacter sp. SG2303]MDN0075414.1 hypothetical protein [Crenobacter sp. SG2303]